MSEVQCLSQCSLCVFRSLFHLLIWGQYNGGWACSEFRSWGLSRKVISNKLWLPAVEFNDAVKVVKMSVSWCWINLKWTFSLNIKKTIWIIKFYKQATESLENVENLLCNLPFTSHPRHIRFKFSVILMHAVYAQGRSGRMEKTPTHCNTFEHQ